jgi:hypothetical protein
MQLPQWRGSVCTLTQPVGMQVDCPIGQVVGARHIPAMQTLPSVHALSHAPQCALFVCTSTQVNAHVVDIVGAEVSQPGTQTGVSSPGVGL